MATHDMSAEDDSQHHFPSVTLDVDEINHRMAARLTSTLLGHMLYMKGQIPFPVNSLERLSSQRRSGDLPPPNSKCTKKRKQFLYAYDDLLSHLRTTFVALSTALAHNPTFVKSVSRPSGETESIVQPSYRPAKVQLVLAMGPSLTLLKDRFLIEFNNFRVEKFGEKEFIDRQIAKLSGFKEEDVISDGNTESDDVEEEKEDGEKGGTVNYDSEAEELGSSQYLSLPSTPSRTASFYTARSPRSERPSPPSTPSSQISEDSEQSSPETSLSEVEIEINEINDDNDDDDSRHCERRLTQTLLKFEEALELEKELAPTQTHILLLAPRRFSHPTWIPRQNLTPLLNKTMSALLEGNAAQKKGGKSSMAFGSNAPTVGLRVVCQSASTSEEKQDDDDDGQEAANDDSGEEEELDELIWWSWDGKLIGFLD